MSMGKRIEPEKKVFNSNREIMWEIVLNVVTSNKYPVQRIDPRRMY